MRTAEDNAPFSGGVFLGGRALSLDHQSANFNQYNGIAPGLFGGGDFGYDSDKYHFDVDGAYLGEDDMYVKANGGKWGKLQVLPLLHGIPPQPFLRGPDHLHQPRVPEPHPARQGLGHPDKLRPVAEHLFRLQDPEEGRGRLPRCDRHIALLLQRDVGSIGAGRGETLGRT